LYRCGTSDKKKRESSPLGEPSPCVNVLPFPSLQTRAQGLKCTKVCNLESLKLQASGKIHVVDTED
jgi:hypothetical protein